MKKLYITISSIVLAVAIWLIPNVQAAFVSPASSGSLFLVTNSNTGVLPVNSFDIGSPAQPVPNIYTRNLVASSTTFSTASGNLNMGGFAITNAGTITGTNFVATSTTASSTVVSGFTVGTSQFVVQQGSGYVGIGTTSPKSLLSFPASTVASGGINFGDDAKLYRIQHGALALDDTTGNSSQLQMYEQGALVGRVFSSNSAIALRSDTAASVLIQTNSATVATFLSGGNVGIGTTSPLGLLSVNPASLGSGVPEFVVGSSTLTHFTVNGNGKVGIGTPYPTRMLTLQDNTANVNPALMSFINANGNLAVEGILSGNNSIVGGDATGEFNIYTPNNFDIYTNNVFRMVVNSSGSVGIASSTPAATLGIKGTAGTIPFQIGSSTNAVILQVSSSGHEFGSTTAPTVSSGQVDGTDSYGTVSGCSSACTVTFNTAYSRPPTCAVTARTGSVVNTFSYAVTATTIVATESGLGTFDYICRGQ